MKNYILLALVLFLTSSEVFASDNFSTLRRSLDSPVETIEEVTPSDDVDLPFKPRGIFIKTAGIVAILDKDGNTITFEDGEIATGMWHPMRPVRVLETTTATVLIGE